MQAGREVAGSRTPWFTQAVDEGTWGLAYARIHSSLEVHFVWRSSPNQSVSSMACHTLLESCHCCAMHHCFHNACMHCFPCHHENHPSPSTQVAGQSGYVYGQLHNLGWYRGSSASARHPLMLRASVGICQDCQCEGVVYACRWPCPGPITCVTL